MDSTRADQVFESGAMTLPPSEPRGSYEDRHDHILNTATHLFAQMGYEKASMRAIAKASGVSLAGLYHYFDSKERLLFVVQFRTFGSLLSNLREKLCGVDEPIDQLRVMVREHVGYFAANMAALKVCSHELDSLTGAAYEETRQIRRDYYRQSRSIIERVIKQHAPDVSVDLHTATMSLFGTLNWLYRWYTPARNGSPNVLASQIATQFLSGLIGGSPATPVPLDHGEPG